MPQGGGTVTVMYIDSAYIHIPVSSEDEGKKVIGQIWHAWQNIGSYGVLVKLENEWIVNVQNIRYVQYSAD